MKILFASLFLCCAGVQAAITVDGHINESEWQDVLRRQDFLITQPYSRQTSDYATEVKILSTEQGLYVGFINVQPQQEHRGNRHARDAEYSEADAVTMTLDVDGSGRAAYFFTVSLGNSIKDGTITNEVFISRDWNGDWQSATRSDEQAWYAELFIPWSSLPMPAVDGDTRELRAGFVRTIASRGQLVASPAAHWSRATYLSELTPLSVKNFSGTGRFDFFPYLTASRDTVANQNDSKAGFDVVWKPNGSDQITATYNPDFGQVESDNLVVNFSAQETFFSEQRPFFTENHNLFDLSGPADVRLVHTRRIGGAPDAGNEGVTDITAAAKYLHAGTQWDYGAFWAKEDDSSAAQGREYAVVRAVHKWDDFSLGLLSTQVDRPTLDRRAAVHTVDGNVQAGDLQWSGMAFYSDIDEAGQTVNGAGSVHTFRYRHSENVTDDLRLIYLEDDLQLRDIGFVERVDLKRLRYARVMSFTADDDNSFSQGREVTAALRTNRNMDDRLLYNEVMLEWSERLRSAAHIEANLLWVSDGLDDLTSEGNGVFEFTRFGSLFAGYFSNDEGQFRIHHEINIDYQGIDEPTYWLHTHPGWVFNDQFSTQFGIFYTTSDDWLLWRDNKLTLFGREEWNMRWDVNANLSEAHEIRLGWQWLSLKADAQQDYAIVNEQLQAGAQASNDFVVSQLAIQLRYTWRLGPLSSFYAVYSRGGYVETEDTTAVQQDTNRILHMTMNDPDAQMFLLKLRLQFGL